jgi:hypothetical protein
VLLFFSFNLEKLKDALPFNFAITVTATHHYFSSLATELNAFFLFSFSFFFSFFFFSFLKDEKKKKKLQQKNKTA